MSEFVLHSTIWLEPGRLANSEVALDVIHILPFFSRLGGMVWREEGETWEAKIQVNLDFWCMSWPHSPRAFKFCQSLVKQVELPVY